MAGSDVAFEFYSQKMKKSRLIWSQENLTKFILKPKKMIPNTPCNNRVHREDISEGEAYDISEFLRKFTLVNLNYLKGMVSNIIIRTLFIYLLER